MRVERARTGDAPAILALYEEAAEWLTSRGIRQWESGAWPPDAIARGISDGEVFVVRAGASLAAALAIADGDPDVWGASDGSALYLHKLTVSRESAGSGLGRRLLDWALDEARARGRVRLRLDCVASNTVLRRYYRAAGFAERGEVDLGRIRLARFERSVSAPR
jgi:ribosomal protein S18 acetylase RimI-like enzyme